MKWMVLGRDRSIPHVGRKIYHLLNGLAIFALYAFFMTRIQAIATLSVCGGLFVIFDLLRLRIPKLNALALRVFGKLMRREELKGISANTFYIWGLLVVLILFPKPVVLLSILFLAVGDPVAAVVGTLYGKHKIIAGKSLEGAAANFVCSGLATFIAGVAYFHFSPDKALFVALIGGAVSTAAELAPLPGNDNFTIPVVSSVLLSLIAAFVPIF